MNPLTQIKNTQKISREEIAAGYSDSQSWHARFKHSAYIFAGGLPYKLTDGDLLAIFSQYGEVIDVNLVRHRDTGKPRGFAFLAYEDQRSTNLAVDNLNGMKVGGRMITVDHVDNYKRKRAEAEGREESESDEEAEADEADADAETAALMAAEGDGAQVISMEEATVQDQGEAEDAPWASKTSVHALLNTELPAKKPPPDDEEEEDPLAAMMKQKKAKKEKKSKKKKDEKERLHRDASLDDAIPPQVLTKESREKRHRPSEEDRRQTSYQRRRSISPERQDRGARRRDERHSHDSDRRDRQRREHYRDSERYGRERR